jgi:hypothetical protein
LKSLSNAENEANIYFEAAANLPRFAMSLPKKNGAGNAQNGVIRYTP